MARRRVGEVTMFAVLAWAVFRALVGSVAGLAVGSCLGVVFGALFEDIRAGLADGALFGAVLGAAAGVGAGDQRGLGYVRTAPFFWERDFGSLEAMKRLAAEALGTFALVFAGTGSVVVNDVSGGAVTHVGVALTFGLVVLAMIYAVGDVSGAHLNPAVTLGFLAARRFPARQVAPYLMSQCAGALAASGLLRLLFPDHPTLGATLPAGPAAQSFVLEVVLTLLLMFVILSVSTGAKEKGVMAGVAVGAVIALEALFAGPISGASMNPARSLAPAVVSGRLDNLWVYLAAPVLGGVAAVLACRCVQDRPCCCAPPEESELAVARQEGTP